MKQECTYVYIQKQAKATDRCYSLLFSFMLSDRKLLKDSLSLHPNVWRYCILFEHSISFCVPWFPMIPKNPVSQSVMFDCLQLPVEVTSPYLAFLSLCSLQLNACSVQHNGLRMTPQLNQFELTKVNLRHARYKMCGHETDMKVSSLDHN